MEQHGGVLVDHGYTHQWDGARNPNTQISGDDYEFFRVTDHRFIGPIPGDSEGWAAGRMKRAISAFLDAV